MVRWDNGVVPVSHFGRLTADKNSLRVTAMRKLKHIREARKLSQWQLAMRTGITPGTISAIEIGKYKNPRYETVRALAEALGVCSDELMQRIA